ncbi:hypothetical protein RZS08_13680, partial [Arthrospira platensis SPKY1]|nr:hypothetical protein [Arthrospira platensis SPKY1]
NNLVLLMMIVFFVVFTFSNLAIFDNEKVAYVDLLGLGLIMLNLFVFKSTQSIAFTSNVTVIALLGSLLSYIFVVGDQDYSYMWAAIFPVAAYLLLNQKAAIFYTVILVVGLVLIQYNHAENFKETILDTDLLIDLLAASFSLLIIV